MMRASLRAGIRWGLLAVALSAALWRLVPAFGADTGSRMCVAVVGDVLLRNLPAGQSPFRYVAPLFAAADVTVCNLEGPLTGQTKATPAKSAADLAAKEQYLVKAPPKNARYLAEAGIDVATLGNNHTMDYRLAGCQDTIRTLEQLGIAHTGAGANAAEARRPAVVKTGSGTVAVLSYLAFVTAKGLGACTPATGTSPGVAVVRSAGGKLSAASRAALKQDIAQAKRRADVVIVAFHWGIQKDSTPTSYHRGLAHTAAELGATAVIGHHPHVLQGVEWYGGRPILYSLGNFVFSPSTGPLGQTGVFYLHFTDGKPVRVDFYPARISSRIPRPLTGQAARSLSQRLLNLSRLLRPVRAVITPAGVLQIPKP